MLSVAMAAIIFWGIALANKAENEMQDMTIADSIRAAGDTLSASADPTKFTGTSAHQESKGYVQELSDLFSGEDDEKWGLGGLWAASKIAACGGYNLGSKAMGASGQGLSAGYVAVHPGEIPYGTKLYITSADNSFVYGFAIAADTGLGLLGNQIDVDLYYDTYLESCLHGKRNVNIYIL